MGLRTFPERRFPKLPGAFRNPHAHSNMEHMMRVRFVILIPWQRADTNKSCFKG